MSHRRKLHSPSTGVEPKADKGPETPSAEPTRVWPEKLIGAKYVRLLEKQLRSLQDENAHGNQKLFLDDVFVVYLLAYFNPTIRSLRTIEDLSQTPHAQRHLSIHRICRSTLSDFNKCIDPERLVPIVQALRNQLSRRQHGLSPQAYDLQDLLKQTVAVDGTFSLISWSVTRKKAGTPPRSAMPSSSR